MISFRYHVVTIVAVFLALGLGILAGTTVLDQGLVSNLKAQTQQLERQAAETRARLGELSASADQQTRLLQASEPFLLQDRLVERQVVVVTYDGADPGPRDDAVTALRDAGAEVTAVLEVTGKVASTDPATQAELASILGTTVPASPSPSAGASPSASASTTLPSDLTLETARRLADRLALGRPETDETPRTLTPDLLTGLIGKGYVKSGVAPSALESVGGSDQVVLVVGGGEAEPPVPISGFLLPLVERLAEHPAAWIGVGDAPDDSADGLVEAVREDDALAGRPLVTVDDLAAETFGGISLVLGLEALIEDGRGGDYGIGDGATALLPPAP